MPNSTELIDHMQSASLTQLCTPIDIYSYLYITADRISPGACVAQRAVICTELVGAESLKKFYGLLISSQGIGVLVGPTIASE